MHMRVMHTIYIYTHLASRFDIGVLWVNPHSARILMIIDMLVWMKMPGPAMVLMFSPAMKQVPNDLPVLVLIWVLPSENSPKEPNS